MSSKRNGKKGSKAPQALPVPPPLPPSIPTAKVFLPSPIVATTINDPPPVVPVTPAPIPTPAPAPEPTIRSVVLRIVSKFDTTKPISLKEVRAETEKILGRNLSDSRDEIKLAVSDYVAAQLSGKPLAVDAPPAAPAPTPTTVVTTSDAANVPTPSASSLKRDQPNESEGEDDDDVPEVPDDSDSPYGRPKKKKSRNSSKPKAKSSRKSVSLPVPALPVTYPGAPCCFWVLIDGHVCCPFGAFSPLGMDPEQSLAYPVPKHMGKGKVPGSVSVGVRMERQVSGPLFFGFAMPSVQAAIRKLPGCTGLVSYLDPKVQRR